VTSDITAPRAAPILFFDGSCVMCNHFARILLQLDKNDLFKFAPLRGETFLEIIPAHIQKEFPDSLVVITENGEILIRSDAVIFIGKNLGGIPRIFAVALSLIPRFLRDGVYRAIAATRHRLFGKAPEQCSIIPVSYRRRILP
jgi:predicted DCC family thiol-disulfide oxidoreductase YuxK